jgi:hypothetical protein
MSKLDLKSICGFHCGYIVAHSLGQICLNSVDVPRACQTSKRNKYAEANKRTRMNIE